jgi:hypothetical protein
MTGRRYGCTCILAAIEALQVSDVCAVSMGEAPHVKLPVNSLISVPDLWWRVNRKLMRAYNTIYRC